jgi:hypothetical protein
MKQFLESSNLLQTIVAESEKSSEAAQALASELSEDQLNWKPSPEQWSIAQCLEHLVIATKGFEKYFTLALEHARKSRRVTGILKYKPSLVGGWLAKQVSPEAARKLPAPKIFRPGNSSDIQRSLESFLNEQDRFVDFVQRSEGIDYNKTRLRSPVTPLMRYSLADAFVITVLHGQRHLGQARRVREMPQFPRS